MPPGQEFTYSNWIEAVRAGHTFVTNGPLLDFQVKSESSISTTPITSRSVELSATAKSLNWFDHLEVLWNGEIIETVAPTDRRPYSAEIEMSFVLPSSGWLAVRCVSDRMRGTEPLPFAHSSAVWLDAPNASSPRKLVAIKELLAELEHMLEGAQRMPRGRRLCHVLEDARTKLKATLS
jgi:hypothetical protein